MANPPKRPAPTETRDPLWFLRDREAFVKRFVMAEVLKPPLALRRRRRK